VLSRHAFLQEHLLHAWKRFLSWRSKSQRLSRSWSIDLVSSLQDQWPMNCNLARSSRDLLCTSSRNIILVLLQEIILKMTRMNVRRMTVQEKERQHPLRFLLTVGHVQWQLLWSQQLEKKTDAVSLSYRFSFINVWALQELINAQTFKREKPDVRKAFPFPFLL